MIKYPHLFLADWPFHTIPEDEYCTFIADRKQLEGDVNSLLKNFCRIDHSTINILWAWYGAGKTHTLKYLSHQCKSSHTAFLSIYNEFPKETKSFLNLYQFFIEKVNIELIKNAFLEVFTSPRRDEAQKQLYYDYPDLSNAMKTLCMESGDKATIAMYWLRAQNVPLRDLSKIGITNRIDNPEKAMKIIAWLVQLFRWSQPAEQAVPARIIWMIDEFQRIARCRPPIQEEINGCLQSVINRCPRSFSLFLSFSGVPGKKMPSWLSKELSDRIGIEKVLVLPPLTTSEAVQFVYDVLDHYRGHNDRLPMTSFPFDDKAIETIIELLQKKTEVKPRTIMQVCDAVLEEADSMIECGELKVIDSDFVHAVLKDRTFIETENLE